MPSDRTGVRERPSDGMLALWLEDADKVERWMGGAKSTYDRRTLDMVKAVRELVGTVRDLRALLAALDADKAERDRVWLAEYIADHEAGWIHGVYASAELAEAGVRAHYPELHDWTREVDAQGRISLWSGKSFSDPLYHIYAMPIQSAATPTETPDAG